MLPIDLKGKTALVTGACNGIGVGIATMMAKAGCNIAGCGLSGAESQEVRRLLDSVQQEGVGSLYRQVDLRNESAIIRLVDDVVEAFSGIDYLVSNAGVNMFTSPEQCEVSYWNDNVDINLKSHWLLSKYAYPFLKRQGGAIILMSSNHGYSTMPDCFPYNVAKAALIGLVNALTVQWGQDIRVVGLAPGFVDTEGSSSWYKSFPEPEKKREDVIRIHPVKRLGTVDEVGAFCAFLCSDYAGFISGTTYLIDGGRSALMQDI